MTKTISDNEYVSMMDKYFFKCSKIFSAAYIFGRFLAPISLDKQKDLFPILLMGALYFIFKVCFFWIKNISEFKKKYNSNEGKWSIEFLLSSLNLLFWGKLFLVIFFIFAYELYKFNLDFEKANSFELIFAFALLLNLFSGPSLLIVWLEDELSKTSEYFSEKYKETYIARFEIWKIIAFLCLIAGLYIGLKC